MFAITEQQWRFLIWLEKEFLENCFTASVAINMILERLSLMMESRPMVEALNLERKDLARQSGEPSTRLREMEIYTQPMG